MHPICRMAAAALVLVAVQAHAVDMQAETAPVRIGVTHTADVGVSETDKGGVPVEFSSFTID